MPDRVFIKDIGRYKVGDIRSWDVSTWKQFSNYEKLTVPLEDVLKAGLRSILNKETNKCQNASR